MGTPEEVAVEEVWALLHGVAIVNTKANKTIPLLAPNSKLGTPEVREETSAALMCIPYML